MDKKKMMITAGVMAMKQKMKNAVNTFEDEMMM